MPSKTLKTLFTVFIFTLIWPVLVQAAPPLSNQVDTAVDVAQANAWMEIDAKNFEDNIKTVQKLLVGNPEFCAVMKSDAYGNGLELLMPSIIKLNIPCVGVTSNEELRIARKLGFNGRLLRVRTASPAEIKGALPYNTEELVGSLALAQDISKIAKNSGRPIRVHLVLNSTDMTRNGLDLSLVQGKKEALEITKNPNLEIAGLMAHFPTKEIKPGLERFKTDTSWLIKAAGLQRNKIVLHAAASYVTTMVAESHLDLVRPGSALYGVMGDDFKQYKRVLLAFKTRVASINSYPKGIPVGYNGTYILKRDSKLANIPIGYSDGYPYEFSNKAYVLINGQKAPVVGLISMNTFMVDVTDIKGKIKPGDEVVLFGKQKNAEITQTQLEEWNNGLFHNLYSIWSQTNFKKLK